MNALLLQKGVYTSKEFEQLFCEHAINFNDIFRQEQPNPACSPLQSNKNKTAQPTLMGRAAIVLCQKILIVRSVAETPAHRAAAADTRHARATTNARARVRSHDLDA